MIRSGPRVPEWPVPKQSGRNNFAVTSMEQQHRACYAAAAGGTLGASLARSMSAEHKVLERQNQRLQPQNECVYKRKCVHDVQRNGT